VFSLKCSGDQARSHVLRFGGVAIIFVLCLKQIVLGTKNWGAAPRCYGPAGDALVCNIPHATCWNVLMHQLQLI